MSMQLQSTSTVLSVSLEKTEPLTAIKNEPPESEIGIDDIPNSLSEEIIPDIKDIDIVSHILSEDLIKSETVIFENNHSGSVETQVFVKTENIPLIKTENITQNEYLYKTQDTSVENVSRGTSQGVIEVQRKEGSNEHFNALQSDKPFISLFKDLSDISRKAKCPNKIYFSESYKTVETTSCEKDRKEGKIIEVPVILIEPHKYTSLVKAKHAYYDKNKSTHEQNKKRYCCEKCTFVTENHSYFKRHKLSHKTKSEVDGRYLKYRCDKCRYNTSWLNSFKRHKLMHLKPEQIPYLYCFHCSYKSTRKQNLKIHIFNHFKNEEVSFHCYICDFTTLKRSLIIEHFKKHLKHHSKCNETDYKNHLETYTMRYCEKCTYTSGDSSNFKLHQLTHKAKIDDRLLKYRCDKCKYKTYRYNCFKGHKLIHLKPEQIPYFYCYHCVYKCKRKSSLKIHIFNHFKNEEVPFHCYICDFTTLKRNLSIEHFKKHPKHHSKCDETVYKNQLETYVKKQMRYCCEKCTYTSGTFSVFKLHQLSHKTKAEIDDRLLKFRCDKCKYKTYLSSSLKTHKLTHLKPEETHYFYCYHCSYKGKQKTNLQTHIFRHFKNEDVPFHCYICDFTTLKRNLIIEHFKKHPKHQSKCDETDYKNQLKMPYFFCYHCSHKSNQKASLQTHIFCHFKNEDVPFHCYICDFTTLKRNSIIEHFKKHPKHHSKCDETDYKNQLETYTKKQMRCQKCTFRTYYYKSLKLHELTHKTKAEMDDPFLKYRCNKCKYKTCRPSNFKVHKLTHLKPEQIPYFYCYHCPYKCKQKSHLKTHINRHFKNEEIPFHCYFCDFVTLTRKSFKMHLKQHNKWDETEYRNQLLRFYKIL